MTNFPLLDNINTYIVNPIIGLLFGLALLYFVYGVFQFIAGSEITGGDKKSIKTGPKHILWATVGLFIMVSVFGIMNILCNSIGCN